MAKGKRITKAVKDIILPKNSYIITDASLKDDFCNYTFEITEGIGLGDTHAVKGKGIIKDDMRHVFGRANVHLAVIDDVFKHSGIEIEDIDQLHAHDLASMYNVTGIIIKGGKENESVILVGNKYVSSAGGRIELKSPKIPLDHLSSYQWYNELKTVTDDIRKEVELYKEGKYTPVDVDDEDDHSSQLKITDMLDKGEESDDDLENSKIQ